MTKLPKITLSKPTLGFELDFSSSEVGTLATFGANPTSDPAINGNNVVGPSAGITKLGGMLSTRGSVINGTSATSEENAGTLAG